MTALEVGATYSCFEDFQAALAKYSRDTNSIYTVFNSKSIEASNRGRTPDKQYPANLKYRFIKYTCKHYGSNRSKSRGLRPNQSSFKIGCPAYIYLSVQKNVLMVEKMETNHSHVCDPDVIQFYPERRSIADRSKFPSLTSSDGEETEELIKSVREDVLDLLRLQVDRRRIRNYVRLRTNKILTAVDLANMAKQMQGQEKDVTDERSYQLLDKLSALESKENAPQRMLEDLAKREKYKSLKRKIAHVKAETGTPGGNESDKMGSEDHGYSTTIQRKWNIPDDHDMSDTLAAKRAMGVHSQGIEWNTHALEEMVKSLNPNEGGPVLVHMNNYDGVMVVEIQNQQGSVTQLEGTVVEVEDVQQGADSRVLADSSVAETPDMPIVEAPRKKSPGAAGKKKMLQFRKRENLIEAPSIKQTSEPKSLIDMALESAQCNPKIEVDESLSPKDLMDHRSDASSDHIPVYDNCVDNQGFSEGGNVYNGPGCRDPEKARLQAETEMLRVKTNKLKLQVKYLKNEIGKQELEKEKLRLEIVVLKARVGVTEMQ